MLTVVNRNQPGFRGHAWLVRHDETGDHYIVSGVTAPFTGWEVLVFPADQHGSVTSWGEVAGGRGISHDEALFDLAEYIDSRPTPNMLGNYIPKEV